MRILIAEDDPFFRRLLQQLLVSECEVATAEDGATAWAMLQQPADKPGLAILDWVMPGMTGPQVCREARANPQTEGIYLILLTAKNSPADILAGLRAGADDYVTKPFEPEELRARVRIGRKVMEMQHSLAEQKKELETALARERHLRVQLQKLEEKLSTVPAADAASV